MTRVLFICHGNICRSPMAEFVMRDLVEKAGLFRVARHVLAPDPEAFITDRRSRRSAGRICAPNHTENGCPERSGRLFQGHQPKV